MTEIDAGRLLVADAPDGVEFVAHLTAFAGDLDVRAIPALGPEGVVPTELARNAIGLVSDWPPRNLADLPRLRWLQLLSAGYEHVLGIPFTTHGVRVSNAAGVNDTPIAEWCLMMMLSFERELPLMLEAQSKREWSRRRPFQSELRTRRLGIVGYGGIGRELARLASAHGMEVWTATRGGVRSRPLAFTPAGTGDPEGVLPSRVYELDDLEEFLAGLDYLAITTALSASTENLIGREELACLPSHAVLLNPARAQVVSESALGEALAGGRIRGAALDSHYREPLEPGDPTWELPNTIVTPHISGSTGSPAFASRMQQLITANVERFVTGQPLLNEIAPADLATA